MSAHVRLEPMNAVTGSSDSERDAVLVRVREELRADHRRLTDAQIDLIANVAVELRLTRVRLGFAS